MTNILLSRRNLLTAASVFMATGVAGRTKPVRAQSLTPTSSMRGGSNNYHPDAPIVDRIGGGGFWMSGTVRNAVDGAPLAGQRIQIWAHTTEGHEREPQSHGATLTNENGEFRRRSLLQVPCDSSARYGGAGAAFVGLLQDLQQ